MKKIRTCTLHLAIRSHDLFLLNHTTCKFLPSNIGKRLKNVIGVLKNVIVYEVVTSQNLVPNHSPPYTNKLI